MPRGNKLKPIFIPEGVEFQIETSIFIWTKEGDSLNLKRLRDAEPVKFTITKNHNNASSYKC